MRRSLLAPALLALALATGGGVLFWSWLAAAGSVQLARRVPIPENHPAPPERETVAIGAHFRSFAAEAGEHPGTWPQFRGPGRNNVVPRPGPLATVWPAAGPAVLWSVALGEGYAAPAVRDGRVYILDYDEERRADALRCFSLASGAELWRRWYEVEIKRNHGRSRTVPAVTEGQVVTLGPKCHVMSVHPRSGALQWTLDLPAAFGTEVPLWYAGQCPLVDGETVVLAPAGKALLVGVDGATGEVRWRTPNPGAWEMSHSSIMPATIGGERQYVYCALGGMVGVAAEGEAAGTILWQTDAWDHTVVAPSPVVFPDGRIFMTSGHGAGSIMLQVRREKDGYGVEVLYELDRGIFACEQQTPILHDGLLYGILPRDAGAHREELVCFDPQRRAPLWTSGKERRFGLGPFLLAGEHLLALAEDGRLRLARAGGERYREVAAARVLTGREAWAPLALVGGRLLARDNRRLVCLDLRPGEEP
jgi:outer membrane protein assembly factor BamB